MFHFQWNVWNNDWPKHQGTSWHISGPNQNFLKIIVLKYKSWIITYAVTTTGEECTANCDILAEKTHHQWPYYWDLCFQSVCRLPNTGNTSNNANCQIVSTFQSCTSAAFFFGHAACCTAMLSSAQNVFHSEKSTTVCITVRTGIWWIFAVWLQCMCTLVFSPNSSYQYSMTVFIHCFPLPTRHQLLLPITHTQTYSAEQKLSQTHIRIPPGQSQCVKQWTKVIYHSLSIT